VIDTEAEEPGAEAVMEETDGQRQRPRNRIKLARVPQDRLYRSSASPKENRYWPK